MYGYREGSAAWPPTIRPTPLSFDGASCKARAECVSARRQKECLLSPKIHATYLSIILPYPWQSSATFACKDNGKKPQSGRNRHGQVSDGVSWPRGEMKESQIVCFLGAVLKNVKVSTANQIAAFRQNMR